MKKKKDLTMLSCSRKVWREPQAGLHLVQHQDADCDPESSDIIDHFAIFAHGFQLCYSGYKYACCEYRSFSLSAA